MGRKKIVRPEEMAKIESAENRLAIKLTKSGTRQAIKIRDRMMSDYLKECLECEVDTEYGEKESVMGIITKNWIEGMLERGVTSRDMETIMKLRGENVTKSQSVNVKIKAEAKTGKTTDEFLSTIGGEKPKKAKKGEDE